MTHISGPCAATNAITPQPRYVFEDREFDSLGELTAHFSRECGRLRAELRALQEGDQALMLQLLQQAYQNGFEAGVASVEYVPTLESVLQG